jgi:hypothetical protein
LHAECVNLGLASGSAADLGIADSAIELRTPDMPEIAEMMRPEDVADTVLFGLARPRHHRMLEVAFRPRQSNRGDEPRTTRASEGAPDGSTRFGQSRGGVRSVRARKA